MGLADEILKRKAPSNKLQDGATDIDKRALGKSQHAENKFLDLEPGAQEVTFAHRERRVVHQESVPNLTTGQVTLSNSTQRIVGPRAGRAAIKVTMLTSTADVFLGFADVTVANGDLLVGSKGASNFYGYSGEWGAVSAGAATISFVELF